MTEPETDSQPPAPVSIGMDDPHYRLVWGAFFKGGTHYAEVGHVEGKGDTEFFLYIVELGTADGSHPLVHEPIRVFPIEGAAFGPAQEDIEQWMHMVVDVVEGRELVVVGHNGKSPILMPSYFGDAATTSPADGSRGVTD